MSRSELLELLIAQMEENESLRSRLEKAEQELENRCINIDKAGSIMEASLLVNGVLEATEKAAEQYLENIRALNDRQEDVCNRMEAEAQEKADAIIADAKKYSEKLRIKTNEYCRQLAERAQASYRKRVGEEPPATPMRKTGANEE